MIKKMIVIKYDVINRIRFGIHKNQNMILTLSQVLFFCGLRVR